MKKRNLQIILWLLILVIFPMQMQFTGSVWAAAGETSCIPTPPPGVSPGPEGARPGIAPQILPRVNAGAAPVENTHMRPVISPSSSSSSPSKPQVSRCSKVSPHTGWGDQPVRITNTDFNSWFVSPRVVYDKEGAAHVIFAQQAGPNLDQPSIYYTTNRSGSWSTPVLIGGAAHSRWPRLAIGPDDHLHVIIPDCYSHQISYVEGIVGGSWSPALTIGTCTSPGPGQADITTDDGGNVHATWWQGMLPNGDASVAQYYRSRTTAGSWSPQVQIPDFVAKHLDVRIVATGGKSGQSAKMYLAFSSDNGANYQSTYEIYFESATVQPGTATFTGIVGPYDMSVETDYAGNMLDYDTSLAVDHIDGTVHLLWTENQPGAYNSNVFYRRSLNGGVNWSASANVSGSSLNTTWQIETDIVARDGLVWFVWNCNWGAAYTRNYSTQTGLWGAITNSMGNYSDAMFTPSITVDDYNHALVVYQLGRVQTSGTGTGIWSNSGTSGNTVKRYIWPVYDGTITHGADWIIITNTSNSVAPIAVYLNGELIYYAALGAGGRQTPNFPNTIGGTLEVRSLLGIPLTTSQRTLTNGSFEEVPAISDAKMSDDWLYSWYDARTSQSDIVEITNPDPTSLSINLFVHGVLVRTFSVDAFSTLPVTLPGTMDGPIELVGSGPDGKPHHFVSTKRTMFGGGFNELQGIDAHKLDTNYLFSWYDANFTKGNDWIVVYNPTPSDGFVNVSVAGQSVGQFSVKAHERIFPTFPGVTGGPLEVSGTATDHQTPLQLMTSQRTLVNGMLEEVPGVSASTLGFSSNFGWYDSANTGGADWIVVVNPNTLMIHVKITLNGAVLGEGDIAAGKSWTPSFPNQIGGPLLVEATVAGQPSTPAIVFSSQRVLESTPNGAQFNETLGW